MTLLRWLTRNGKLRYPALLRWIWLYFLIRAAFYASVIPIWEGYDEWSHFAYIEHVVAHSELPVAANTRVSREIERSLQLMPLPWAAKDSTSKHIHHDEYWKAPDQKRLLLRDALHSIPPDWRVQPDLNGRLLYEAQQPPLYYWLMSIPLRATRNATLVERVYLVRYLSVAVASLLIPIGFLVARRVFGRDDLALAVAAFMAAMPGLMIDICRVGNESFAIVLFSMLVLFLLRYFDPGGGTREALVVGFIAGLGLLAKAYFLTALPAIALILAVKFWRAPYQRRWIACHLLLIAGTATIISGWWYYRNWATTGFWSGEQQEAILKSLSLWEVLRHASRVDWASAADSAFFSYIWFGAWSFLQMRWWIYHLFRFLCYAGVIGLLLMFLRPSRRRATEYAVDRASLFVLLCLVSFFIVGLGYHVLVTFVANGLSATCGWYGYALVVAECILMATGWMSLGPRKSGKHIMTGVIAAFVLLDFYGMHFLMIPYYSGIIEHTPAGALQTLHVRQLWETGLGPIAERIAANKPALLTPAMLIALWISYLICTLRLPFSHRRSD